MTTASDAATYARALLPRAIAAFAIVPPDERDGALAAIDAFVAHPSPASFLRATRQLSDAHRAARLAAATRPTIARLHADGLARLGAVPGFPGEILARLSADLPMDARTGRRLGALATLLGGYEELLGRVVADSEEMKRLLRTRRRAPRPPAPRAPGKRRR